MRKAILILLVFLLAGCTVVRIDTSNIDTIINVVLSKDNNLYNRIGKGYKYFCPGGVAYITTNEYNEKLYSDGNYYYLYVDIISYYYKKEFKFEENNDIYYSKKIEINNKNGYLEIRKKDEKYLINFYYNYANIEALVKKEDINKVILNASYILSTIKYNSNVIKAVINEDYFENKETTYTEFIPEEEEIFLEYDDSEG
ncbi:MAG: hypothetical protein PHU94_03720 [Bacilli bacterium]|nr:hypothetical protein [Bacilli bacterium]MDD4733618.1 hypothetical protein [Bacilli bacterium]